MKSNAWFPFDVGAYLRDTMDLTTEEHGAYALLLFAYWTNGPLPNDEGRLANIARVSRYKWRKKIAPRIMRFFGEVDGFLRQKRMDNERHRHEQICLKRARAAGKRWENRDANASTRTQTRTKSTPKPSTRACPPKAAPVDEPSLFDAVGPVEEEVEQPRSPPPSTQRRSRITPDWMPDEDGRAFAHEREIEDIPREVTRFRDYHQAKGSLMANWAAAWRTWCGKAQEFRQQRPQGAVGEKQLGRMEGDDGSVRNGFVALELLWEQRLAAKEAEDAFFAGQTIGGDGAALTHGNG